MLNGFYRIACGIPQAHVANPVANALEIAALYRAALANGAAALVTPELSLTGATCGDLFEQPALLEAAESALAKLVGETAGHSTILIVGMPLRIQCRLYNAAVVLQNGGILGVCGKTYLANYRSAYEKRQFRSVSEHDGGDIILCGEPVPFGNDLLFDAGNDFVFSCAMLEDLRAVIPPTADLALNGAKLFFCLGADAELAGKSVARAAMLSAHARQLSCICALANAGVYESTTDEVCSGHALVCENGDLLAENPRFEREATLLYTEVNPGWMEHQRRCWSNFNDCAPITSSRTVPTDPVPQATALKYRTIGAFPFIPADPAAMHERSREILSIQSAALAKRMEHTCAGSLVIGLSGGLDSTLALLVCAEACDLLKKPRNFITAITMPGMGTTSRTHDNAKEMALALGTDFREIPIRDAVLQHFQDIGHDPAELDVTYENSQARERTQILMDLANELGGMVIGTGDLSEIALGWDTYNGDHMSMYAVNADVPKSLIRHIVEDYAAHCEPRLAAILRDVNATPVSPELLPGGTQKTEGILGSYTLHDFFLYYFMRYAESPANLQALARCAFSPEEFPEEEIQRALQLFVRRFFTQQFKRNCSPDGPKVGSIALSPRGDWKMPSDAEWTPWTNISPLS